MKWVICMLIAISSGWVIDFMKREQFREERRNRRNNKQGML